MFLSDVLWWKDVIAIGVFTIPFYLNIGVVLPLMPKYKLSITLPLSLSIYFGVSIGLIYTLYTLFPSVVLPLEIVGKGHLLGAVLHLSFVFYPISAIAKILTDKILKMEARHKNALFKVSREIEHVRSGMSFDFLGQVLNYLTTLEDENKIVNVLYKLNTVVSYKLQENGSTNIALQEELRQIQEMLDLLSEVQHKSRKVFTHENSTIRKGSAFKAVEDYLIRNPDHQGLILVTSDEEKIWVSGR